MTNWLKYKFNVLIVIVLISMVDAFAQNVGDKLYKIQVGAYKNVSAAKTTNLDTVGTLFYEVVGNGITRIVLGYYADRAQADKVLEQVKNLGYEQAFVGTSKADEVKALMAQYNEITPPTETVTAPKPTTTPPTETVTAPKSTPPPTKTVTTTTKIEKPTVIDDGKVYVIDLGEYVNDATAVGSKFITKNIGKVYQNGVQGNVLLGSIEQLSKAEKLAEMLKENGFEQVKIRSIEVNDNTKQHIPPAVKPTPSTTITTPTTPVVPATTNVPKPFESFDALFRPTTFNIYNVDAYDPTQEKNNTITNGDQASRNQNLKGVLIPSNLVSTFDSSVVDPALSFYALDKFDVNPNLKGYIVRSGMGLYDKENNINLYVFDKKLGRFAIRQPLSSVTSSETKFSKTQSWLMDLDNDGVVDVLSYTAEEIFEVNTGAFLQSSFFAAKVWRDGKLVDAQIVNEPKLKKQLGIN